jgi:thioredoxin 1
MASENVIELTDSNFEQEVMEADKPVLVDFWAEWCMPCKMLAPTIEEIADEYGGKIKVGKLDIDSNREVATSQQLSAIPTIILFHKGEVVRTFVGVTPKQEFVGEIDKLVGQEA